MLKTAVHYGADAVYIGGPAFSLRARADNFDFEKMEEALFFSHSHGVRVYVAVNIFAHNKDMKKLAEYLKKLSGLRPDGLIISDPGVFLLASRFCPGIDIHISTQLNSTNYETFLFWEELGAKRVIASRELSLDEIGKIREMLEEDQEKKGLKKRMEIEAFVHGSMCISYSGRCLVSAYMTGRSANNGECAHPCRWRYALMEEKRPGEYFPIDEDERGTYFFNSRDLCMIEHIPELIDAGVDSFKVEGRMKSELYAATVARVYRKAIDDYFEDLEIYKDHIPIYLKEIEKCTYRGFTTGFYFGSPGAEGQIYDGSTYIKNYIFLGEVLDITKDGLAIIEQKNKFSVGDHIEILKPDLSDISVSVAKIQDAATMEELNSCPHPKQKLMIRFIQDGGKVVIPGKHELLAKPHGEKDA